VHCCEVEVGQRVGGEVEGGKPDVMRREGGGVVEEGGAGWRLRETVRASAGCANGREEGVEGLREGSRTIACSGGGGERVGAVKTFGHGIDASGGGSGGGMTGDIARIVGGGGIVGVLFG
jgi:hypothetical protein